MVRAFFVLLFLAAGLLRAEKFYPDDPLWKEPRPRQVENAKRRKLSDYHDLFLHTFTKPGEVQPPRSGTPIRARGVNTLGEVPDSGWYQNRHGRQRMSIEELMRGPDSSHAPSMQGPWQVLEAKSEGVTPGFLMRDSGGRRYYLKFDPMTNPEMATAADAIGSRFFHAFGYHVPKYYLVTFPRKQLVIDPKAKLTDGVGKERPMTGMDVDEILHKASVDNEGRYRAVASLYLSGVPLREFRYHGARKDDPNDIVPHEHRRDLRGLYVFCAWLAHEDSRAINTIDMLVEEDGVRYIKHHLLDFGAILGSASEKANPPRAGFRSLFSVKPAAGEMFTLGLYVPRWARARYPNLSSVGRFESAVFSPDDFKTEYRNPAFENRLPDDTFWAAKQVMAFTNEEIRAIVSTGQYSDPLADDYLVTHLSARRDKIGKTYFARVLPLDGFAVKDGRLVFEDLAAKYKFAPEREYAATWSRFDNRTLEKTPIAGAATLAVPSNDAPYLAAEIRGDDAKKTLTVYLRNRSGQWEVVGIDRHW